MSKSKMKVSKRWNSLIRIAGGDCFSRVYKVTSVSEKNARNEEYYNLSVAPAGYAPEEYYRRAEKLYNDIAGGGVVINHEYESGEPEAAATGDSGF
jgi:hypothetical protein